MAGKNKHIKHLIGRSKSAFQEVQKLNVSLPSLKRKRHPATQCLNCQLAFDIETNYCPRCGQENNHSKLSFWRIITDFLHNYFSFDSRFGHSLLPFFFNPGALTNYYTEGKRAAYINPIRLYLIVSLLFFFVFSMMGRGFISKAHKRLDETNQTTIDSVSMDLSQIISIKWDSIEHARKDSIAHMMAQDTTLNPKDVSVPDDFLSASNGQIYISLRKDRNLSALQIMDSLDTHGLSAFERKLVLQAIKTDQMPKDILMSQILQNLPIMMMVLLPLLALILKLFYLKKDIYYFSHLIHLIHLHSFIYFVFGIGAILVLNHDTLQFSYAKIWPICFILVTIYATLSFRKVYAEGWIRTLIKYLSIGFIYLFILVFASLTELLLTVFNL